MAITIIFQSVSNVMFLFLMSEKKASLKEGYVLDFCEIKPLIRKLCKSLNDTTLLPEKSKELSYETLDS